MCQVGEKGEFIYTDEEDSAQYLFYTVSNPYSSVSM
jgi:hypothetical protein